jgi:CRISPR-associated protein Csb3
MTGIVLGSADPTRLLSHLAAYGLAAIIEDSGAAGVVLSWTRGMNPRPWVRTRDLDADAIATIVHQHAAHHAGPDSWLWRDVHDASGRGLMSPRISAIEGAQGWTDLQRARHEVLDHLIASTARLDQRLVQALGEPAYWRFDAGKPRQDEGASQLDMTPRNRRYPPAQARRRCRQTRAPTGP